jgi:hypothetical protein
MNGLDKQDEIRAEIIQLKQQRIVIFWHLKATHSIK